MTTTVPERLQAETLGELAAAARRLVHRWLKHRLGRGPFHVDRSNALRKLRCIVALLLVGVLSVVLARLAWNSTVDHRLRLFAASHSDGRVLEFSLEDKTTTRTLEGALSGRTSLAKPGQPGTARDSAPGGTSRGAGVAIDGPVLATLSAGLTLSAGAVAGWALLRRLRDSDDDERDVEGLTLPEVTAQEPTDEEEHELPRAESAGEHDEEHSEEQHELPRAESAGEHDQEESVSGDAGDGVATPSEAAVASSAPLHEPPLVTSMQDTRQNIWSRGLRESVAYQTGERLYERRRSPRVPVDLPGRLRWLGTEWSVSVVEVSEGGLRFSAPVRPSVPGRRGPLAPTDHVTISFPAVSGDVEASARVAWHQTSPEGYTAGVCFASLSPDDLDRLGELCDRHAGEVG